MKELLIWVCIILNLKQRIKWIKGYQDKYYKNPLTPVFLMIWFAVCDYFITIWLFDQLD